MLYSVFHERTYYYRNNYNIIRDTITSSLATMVVSYYCYVIVITIELDNIILLNINLLYKSRHASWVCTRAHESADSQ